MASPARIINGYRQLLAGTFPHAIPMDFERADLCHDRQWFQYKWGSWPEEMVTHALAICPVFVWATFRAWLANYKRGDWATLQQQFDNAPKSKMHKP